MCNYKKINFNELGDRFSSSSLKYKTNNIIPLTIACMDFDTPEAIKDSLIKRITSNCPLGYTRAKEEIYTSFIDYIKKHEKWNISKEQIEYSYEGVGRSIQHIIERIDNSGKVIFETPYYSSFKAWTKSKGYIIFNDLINLKNLTLFKEQVEKEKPIALLISNPNNPTGKTYSFELMQEIIKICKKENIYILSDEIHCENRINEKEFISFGKFFNEYEKIIVFKSPNKAFSITGLKFCSIIFANEDIKKRIGFPITIINPLTQEAVIAAYSKCDRWLDECNNYLKENHILIKEKFSSINIPYDIPDFSFLAWIDVSSIAPGSVISNFSSKFGVSIIGGKTYGDDRFIRVNVATSRDNLEEGLNRLLRAIKKI